jgi:hypothetical protein
MGKNIQDTNKNSINNFVKGLNKDSDPSFVSEGMWTHAVNASNNTAEGDVGSLSNESSNYLCGITATTLGPANSERNIIGAIHLLSDKWIIFTAVYNSTGLGNSIGSEIGLFEEDLCRYRPIVQDTCLNFSKWNLITGASREREDCSLSVYFADGLNPDKSMNVGDPQTWPPNNYLWIGNNTYSDGVNTMQWPGVTWEQICTDSTGVVQTSPGVWPAGSPIGCITCANLTTLDCDALRLARLMTTPEVTVSKGVGSGSLRNGSYFALIAYSIKGQKVTDYFSQSNTQPIWVDDDVQGSLNIEVKADKDNFDEFILVIVETINQATVAKEIGVYSTNTSVIHLDQIKEDLISIPLRQLPIQTPVFEKSDQMIEVNNYLLRVGPTSRFDFNYQPLANLIETEWVSVEYPGNYYFNGGSKPSFLRDEVYAFFIRWVYNTGDKSSSYHIPGRAAESYKGNIPVINGLLENAVYVDNNSLVGDTKVFQTYNTASVTSTATTTLPDGGKVLSRGKMAYWESTEIYPDKDPVRWNSSEHCWTATTDPKYDLCGTPIRHHKFPENATDANGNTNHFATPTIGGGRIRLLGVDFANIIYPKDNDGNDIPGIVGYEILRGSREGNRSIIAKGMINNMRPYNRKGAATNQKTGLYPNHPFNTINPIATTGANDPFIIGKTDTNQNINYTSNDIPKDIVTFHSPDTNFRTPFLSTTELKLYGHLQGNSEQQFIEPEKHPQFKLMRNTAMFIFLLTGLAEVIIGRLGRRTINSPGAGYNFSAGPDVSGGSSINTFTGTWGGALGTGVGSLNGNIDTSISTSEEEYSDWTAFNAQLISFNTSLNTYNPLLEGLFGTNPLDNIYSNFNEDGADTDGGSYTAPYFNTELSRSQYLGSGFSQLASDLQNFCEGADVAQRFVMAVLPYRQYALQMVGHGYYSSFVNPLSTTRTRFNTHDELYLKDSLQTLRPYLNTNTGVNTNYTVNNLKRQNSVVIRTTGTIGGTTEVTDGPRLITGATEKDESLITIGEGGAQSGINHSDNKSKLFSKRISSHYGGIKVRIDNQYGQLNSIKQVVTTPYEQQLQNSNIQTVVTGAVCPNGSQVIQQKISSTDIFFGGDTYINRYTEKNSMFFFYDWLYDLPNGFEYNYLLRQMIPQPKYWANSEEYQISELFSLVANPLSIPAFILNPPIGSGLLPSNYYNLDGNSASLNALVGVGVNNAYFYLATSSVRDFYVESDVIVDFRQDGDVIAQKNYNPYKYTDYIPMFSMNPEVITKGNYYAYDYSLSLSKIFTQYFSQGILQNRYYDPYVSKLCYTYYPDRIIYSLPQQMQATKDSWYIYLINNYKDFETQISGVKNFAKTGIFITFKNSSPLVFQGVDSLQTDSGTKITIGDGGLFGQTPQSVVIADQPYEYGSSQNRFSVISTPAGMYYISQNQGKIFKYGEGISEISQKGLKWWFNLFLPYKLTLDFPDYPHQDNPVAGIGCQSIYDNANSLLYFSKIDYQLKAQFKGLVTFNFNTNSFMYNKTEFLLGDPLLFDDASWTISYDPKSDFWISYHDWHPDLMLPSKNTFLTVKDNGIYVHNNLCNSFGNYYGVDYPFEVEIPLITGQTVTTLKSVEYILECYRRSSLTCVDQFQVLDYNFDRAVVYNSEQVSGYLNLNIFPKNNISLSLQYPKLNVPTQSFDILFSKEENKYRFNQFWDITKNRGEFPNGSGYPPTGPLVPGTTTLLGNYTEENLWVTSPNGYTKVLNSTNLNYTKPEMERKKFRHYLNFLYLRRNVSGDVNMILKLLNTKNQISQR